MPKQPGDIANPNPNLSPEVSGGGGGGGGSKTNPPRRAQQDSAGAADGAAAPTHREKIVFAGYTWRSSAGPGGVAGPRLFLKTRPGHRCK